MSSIATSAIDSMTAGPGETLQVTRQGTVLDIVLSRPQARNAIDEAMLSGLERTLTSAAGDASLGVVILRGSGGFFCAGGDLKERERLTAAGDGSILARRSERDGGLLQIVSRMPQVVVVVVEGGAVGLGLGIACAGDLVLAARPAVFGAPEVRKGALPAQIAPFVARRLGPGQARRLLLTGVLVEAEEALCIGVVHELAPDAEKLGEMLKERSSLLGTYDPSVLARTKALLEQGAHDELGYRVAAGRAYAELALARRK
jgi:isohexenylglutaconyl-CoA hydratase